MDGGKIKQYRKQNFMTQAELGRRLGVTDRCISAWESGRNEPNLDMVYEMSRIFGVQISDLLNVSAPRFRDSLSTADEELIDKFHKAPLYKQKAIADMLGLEFSDVNM